MLTGVFRDGRRLLTFAGFITLLLVGVPNVLKQLIGAELGTSFPVLDPGRFTIWLAAALIFAVAFWHAMAKGDRHRRQTFALLVVQSAAALVMFHITCTGYESTQLVVVAAQLGLLFPLRVGLVWIVLVSAVQAWLGTYHWTLSEASMWGFGLTLPYEFLALLTSYFAASQFQARENLSRANAELLATQVLLADSSRMAERVRISRELHDLLGHHLAALNLQLEAAKLLLADLRDAVSTLRERDTMDLSRALGPLADAVEVQRVEGRLLAGGHHFNQRRSSDWMVGVRRVRL